MKKHLLLIVVSIWCSLSFGQLNSGLVAQYDFFGNANDASGNGLNPSINKALPAADRFGNPNSAYQFVGDSNTYIEIPHSNLLNLQSDKTISVWFKLDSVPVNYYPSIVYKEGQNYSFPTFGIQLNNDPGYSVAKRYKVSFYFGNGAVNKSVETKESYKDTANLGKWIHIVATYSITSGYQKIYFNNVLSDSSYIGNFVSDTSSKKPLVIGRSTAANNYAGNHFKGYVDDIRIYNRELSIVDIDSIFNLPNPTLGIDEVNPLMKTEIYPNPSSNNIYITNITEPTLLSIFDITGKLYLTEKISADQNSIPVNNLKQGVYVIQLSTKAFVKNHKLIVE